MVLASTNILQYESGTECESIREKFLMSLMQYKGTKMVKLTYNQNSMILKRILYNYSSWMIQCLGQVPSLWNELYSVLVTMVLVAMVTMETTDF